MRKAETFSRGGEYRSVGTAVPLIFLKKYLLYIACIRRIRVNVTVYISIYNCINYILYRNRIVYSDLVISQ